MKNNILKVKKTFQIVDGEEVLMLEESLNKDNYVLEQKDHRANPSIERSFKYNENNALIEEKEIGNSIELSRIESSYNKDNQLSKRCFFASGELYEEMNIDFKEHGFEKTIYIEGLEREKIVNEKKGKNYINKFYEDSILVETQLFEWNAEENSSLNKLYNLANECIGYHREYFSEEDKLVKTQAYSPLNELLEEITYLWKGDLLMEEKHTFFRNMDNSYAILFYYDEHNNEIKNETIYKIEGLSNYHLSFYDAKQRLIEEKAYTLDGELETLDFHFKYQF